jgi:uncharacterized protein with HEPN domain
MSKKKQRDIALFIVDIFVAISKTKEYVAPFNDEEEFRHSSLHWDATIRQLEIIGEALNKLLEDDQFNASSPSYFRKIVNFRNVIAHSYFGIDALEVWDVITNKLILLDNDLKNVVHTSNINIAAAIEAEIIEYFQLVDKKTVGFLKKLNKEMY